MQGESVAIQVQKYFFSFSLTLNKTEENYSTWSSKNDPAQNKVNKIVLKSVKKAYAKSTPS